jgi:hypothetical protein
MDFLTSRAFELPRTREDWRGEFHFNLWRTRQWPYRELQEGARLFWYETPLKRLSWETRVARVGRFEYRELDEAVEIITRSFGSFDEQQAYMQDKPSAGYGLVYASEPIRRVDRNRPEGFTMPRLGWLRIDEQVKRVWHL